MGDKQVDAFPTHLVIDKKGKIAFSGIGGAPNSVYWVRKTIDELITQ